MLKWVCTKNKGEAFVVRNDYVLLKEDEDEKCIKESGHDNVVGVHGIAIATKRRSSFKEFEAKRM